MMKNDRGFTLLEVVIAMVLMGMVLLVGSQLIFSGIKSWIHGEEQIDVVQNMRAAMDYMTRDIRTAGEVKTANTSNIKITIPKADFSTVGVIYQFDPIDKEVERKEGTAAPQPVASRISNLTFTYTGDPIRFVSITLTGMRNDGQEITMKSMVSLRAAR